MGVPTSEVGDTSVMPRREDDEVRKGHEGALDKKIAERKIKKDVVVKLFNARCKQ